MRSIVVAATAILSLTSGIASAALPAGFTVSVEAAGAQNTTATFDYYGIETFDLAPLGQGSYNAGFGNGPISGTYTGLNVIGSNQYGGAGGAGQYAVAGLGSSDRSYSIDFTNTGANGVNYFGYWLSALDAGNMLEFYSGANLLGTFSPTDVISFVGLQGPYYGNPNGGQNAGEPYVFVNFFMNDQSSSFDRIVFKQAPGSAGYESDNHTVGWYKDLGDGTVVPSVPEPGTWAMMMAGFGVMGWRMRRRSSAAAVSVTA